MDWFVHPLPSLLHYVEDLHALLTHNGSASFHLLNGLSSKMCKEAPSGPLTIGHPQHLIEGCHCNDYNANLYAKKQVESFYF